MGRRWFTVHFDIAFFPNRVRITDTGTGVTIDRTAEQPFSSDCRLLDDRDGAASFIHDVFRDMARNGSRGRSGLTFPTAEVTIAAGPDTHNDRREVEHLLTEQGMFRVSLS